MSPPPVRTKWRMAPHQGPCRNVRRAAARRRRRRGSRSLTVSVTSLFVAIRHGRSMDRMAEANARLVQANSWPLLQRYQSDLGAQGARVYSLDVVNNGVGPAKVESVERRRRLPTGCLGTLPVSTAESCARWLTSGAMTAGGYREALSSLPHRRILRSSRGSRSLWVPPPRLLLSASVPSPQR